MTNRFNRRRRSRTIEGAGRNPIEGVREGVALCAKALESGFRDKTEGAERLRGSACAPLCFLRARVPARPFPRTPLQGGTRGKGVRESGPPGECVRLPACATPNALRLGGCGAELGR